MEWVALITVHQPAQFTTLSGHLITFCVSQSQEQEFIRVGYHVNNDYEDEELRDTWPEKIQIDKVMRTVLTEQPRVTTLAHDRAGMQM
jgi:hypothetical protein